MPSPPPPSFVDRRWPLPALVAWALAWAVLVALQAAGAPAPLGFVVAAAVPVWPALHAGTPWRRALVAGGFPLSAGVLGGAAAVPAWLWLLPLAVLLLVYPVRAWRDAPVFPTAPEALAGLDAVVALPDGARILDAGSGLGHGLQALRRVWPRARIAGVERSAPLAWISRRRCPGADVRCADMWAASWAGHDLVYLFQRPESMARAWAKACAEMAPGCWLASLEFEIPGVAPTAVLRRPGQRPLHVYRVPPGAAVPPGERLGGASRPVPAQPGRESADKSPTTARSRAVA
jgi:hypothetical protein